jgi:hypothetical protein
MQKETKGKRTAQHQASPDGKTACASASISANGEIRDCEACSPYSVLCFVSLDPHDAGGPPAKSKKLDEERTWEWFNAF